MVVWRSFSTNPEWPMNQVDGYFQIEIISIGVFFPSRGISKAAASIVDRHDWFCNRLLTEGRSLWRSTQFHRGRGIR